MEGVEKCTSSRHREISFGTCAGRADLCSSNDGQFVFVSGEDSQMKKFALSNMDVEAENSLQIDDDDVEVSCLNAHPSKPDMLAFGTKDGAACIYDFAKQQITMLSRYVWFARFMHVASRIESTCCRI